MAIGNGPNSRGALTVGFLAILIFFGVFGSWAATAPLESAVVAGGVVGVESRRKTIQHLEGGIVREILVKDGDRVETGEVLIRLDNTQADAKLELLRRRYDIAQARQARLVAERDGRDTIDLPEHLLRNQSDPAIAEVVTTQADILREKRESLRAQIAIQHMLREQLGSQITGLEGTIAAQDREIALLKDEIGGLKELYEKRVIPKMRFMELQRGLAELEGNRSQNQAALARANQGIEEAQLRIDALKSNMTNEAAAQLEEVRSTLLDLDEQIRAAEDIRERVAIVAPHAGTVLNLSVHTPGGVIAPGEQLLDLLPLDDRLVVEARINPQDIDIVRAGLKAQVRFTAFNQRHVMPLPARVVQVSADRLEDSKTAAPYYAARIELLQDPVEVGLPGPVTPGMPAEIIIIAGQQTLMDYLVEPLATVIRRSLRET